MIININLEEGINSAAVDFEQSDIENMWNHLSEDRENFEYQIVQYLNTNFDNFKDEWANDSNFEELYNNLKQIYE